MRKWLRYLAAFLMGAGFLHHLVVQAIDHNAWLWSFAIAACAAAPVVLGNVAVDVYIRCAPSIFEN